MTVNWPPWEVLLRKASQDEYVADHLIELPDSPDAAIGFHLQQAAEKLLKALLAFRQIKYRYTHILGDLISLLEEAGDCLPTELENLRALTPYATEWRYDIFPEEEQPLLDRCAARSIVKDLRIWVEARIRAHGEKAEP